MKIQPNTQQTTDILLYCIQCIAYLTEL